MNMNLPNDNGVKELVQFIEFKINAAKQTGCSEKEARVFSEIRDFLQAYLKASAEMPEKKEEIKLADKKGNSRFNHYVRGFNDCREQAILAFMKSFEGFERTISELREQIAKGEAISEKEILIKPGGMNDT